MNKLYYYLIITLTISITTLMLNKYLFKIIFSIIWAIASILIIYSSLHYTKKLKLKQLKLKLLFKSIKHNNHFTSKISSIEALTLSMGEKIGIGSIAGTALAIYYGGLGTIFWILIFTIISSINSYVEAYLGIKYQIKEKTITYGGPAYYIKNILKNEKLGKLYALIIICAYSGIFLAIQSNTIVKSINYSFNINTTLIIIILLLTSSIIYLKNIKKITTITSILVPFMLIIYISVALIIIISNKEKLPYIIKNIIISAFNIKSGTSGFLYMIIISLQRTIFATESGIGTTAVASSLTTENPDKQGMLSIISVYITTFVICLSTALIIATSNYQDITIQNINGIELTIYAFNYHLGTFGNIILTIIIVLFAYSTIISGYFLGEVNLNIFPSIKKKYTIIFKTLSIIIIFIGSVIKPNIIWNIVDLLVAILTIINIYTMLKITK